MVFLATIQRFMKSNTKNKKKHKRNPSSSMSFCDLTLNENNNKTLAKKKIFQKKQILQRKLDDLKSLKDIQSTREESVIHKTNNTKYSHRPDTNINSTLLFSNKVNDILDEINHSLFGKITDDMVLTYLNKMQMKYPNMIIINHEITEDILSKRITKDIRKQLEKDFDVAYFLLKDKSCDHSEEETPAGHWTLLSYFKDDPIYYHYDPVQKNCSTKMALELSNELKPYIGGKYLVEHKCGLEDGIDCVTHAIQNILKIIYLQRNHIVNDGIKMTYLDIDKMESYGYRTKLDIIKTYVQDKIEEAEEIIVQNMK